MAHLKIGNLPRAPYQPHAKNNTHTQHTHKNNTHTHNKQHTHKKKTTHTHTNNTHTHLLRNIFANSDVECILRAKSLQLNLTRAIEWSEVRNLRLKFGWHVTMQLNMTSPSCDLNAPRSDTAGTEVCVQTSIQLISIASLAWLGNQPSRPLQLKRRLDKRLVKYSKLVHCNGKEPDTKKQFRQTR